MFQIEIFFKEKIKCLHSHEWNMDCWLRLDGAFDNVTMVFVTESVKTKMIQGYRYTIQFEQIGLHDQRQDNPIKDEISPSKHCKSNSLCSRENSPHRSETSHESWTVSESRRHGLGHYK